VKIFPDAATANLQNRVAFQSTAVPARACMVAPGSVLTWDSTPWKIERPVKPALPGRALPEVPRRRRGGSGNLQKRPSHFPDPIADSGRATSKSALWV
jgi:hypothetical protein